jgi:uncharacterized protein (DUF849 family)
MKPRGSKESKEMKRKQDKHEAVANQEERLEDGGSRRDFLIRGGTGLAVLGGAAALGVQTSQLEARESGSEERRMAVRNTPVEDIPVVLESAINGSTTKKKNRHAPETVEEQVTEMVRVLDAGAAIAHNHSNHFHEDPIQAARFYAEVNRQVLRKRPHAITYPTVNLDVSVLRKEQRALTAGAACAHQRVLAKAGLSNMIMLDTGSIPVALLEKDGIANDDVFFIYQFWPDDVRFSQRTCADFGCGAAVAVYEPGWMKTVVAMARAGTLPRGSKLNLFFGDDRYGCMAPPVPEALELYLKMMEGLDLKWAVACPAADRSIMDTPLARMALERGGSLRIGLEDYTTGPSNLEQLERAKELVAAVGRRIIHGPEAIEYLDISLQSPPEDPEDDLGSDELMFGARQVDPPLLVC